MPLVPLSVPAAIAMAVQRPNSSQIDTQLTILWSKRTATTSPPGFIFENAQATYGPTILTCDRLTLDLEPGHKHLLAEGHVHVLDIDGTLDADRLFVDWINRSGSAINADVEVQGFMLHAKSAILSAKLYELDDLYATPCAGESTPIISITAPRAFVDPLGDVRITKPTLYLYDKKVITLRQYDISPNRKSNSLPLPNISYSRGSGFSEGWTPSLLLNETTSINGSEHMARNSRPSEDLQVSTSLLPPSVAAGGFVPSSDFSERFGFSYFENVYVSSPVDERWFTAGRRLSLSASTTWNEFPIARQKFMTFNKPVELVAEAAGPIGSAGLYGQVRAQRIEQIGGPQATRAEGFTSLSLPQTDILPHLYTDLRVDGFGTLGDAKPFGWVHAQIGLVNRPNSHFRFGLAYMKSANFGQALFATDELFRVNTLSARADIEYGPRTASLLLKYDPRSHFLYDTEVEFSQDIKCFQPYFIYRVFPRGYYIGLRLRLDRVGEVLRRRGAIKPNPNDEDR